MYKKILIPTDGSPRSDLAVREGVELGLKLDAEVMVLHVVPVAQALAVLYSERTVEAFKAITEELEKSGEEILQKVKAGYQDKGLNVNTKMLKGNAAYEICNEAREGRYDLIVMANRGLGEIKGYLLGSVSNRVVRHASCSVLIVK